MTKWKQTRRGFLASGTAALAAPAILGATRAYAADPVLRIGHVIPTRPIIDRWLPSFALRLI